VRRPGQFRFAVVGAFLALTIGLFAASSARADGPQFPPLTGRIVDEANLLSPPARDRITAWLEQFERDTKRQVVVATVKSLQGYPIEDYGYQLGRAWGIGEKDKNTGAILLVAPNERKVRIEVGYGLEGELTDAISKTIIEQDILPSFRQNNYEQGIVAGTAAILTALGWNGAAAAVPTHPAAQNGSLAIFPILFFIVMFGLFIFRMMRPYRRYPGSGVGMFALGMMAGGMGRSGGFGGGLDGGGFSGGGGSFGGGGASGSW